MIVEHKLKTRASSAILCGRNRLKKRRGAAGGRRGVRGEWYKSLPIPLPLVIASPRLRVPGGHSIYPRVGRCGPAPHTLTLFKTKIADFPTLFKTEFRFLIPCLRHLTRNYTLCKTIINIETLSYLIHWQSQNYLQLD